MTEPNDPTPPLSRMRFSWQRGTPAREGDPAPPPPAYDQDPPAHTEEQSGYEHAAHHQPAYETAYDQQAYDQQVQRGQPPQPPQAQQASRLGRATDPHQTSAVADDAVTDPYPTTRDSSRDVSADSIVAERFDLDEEDRRWSVRTRQVARSRSAATQSTTTGAAPTATPGTPAAAGTPATAAAGRARTASADSGRSGARTRTRERSGSGRRQRDRAGTGNGFEVPKPGGRFSGGRGSHAGIRVILLLTACLLVLGITGYAAYTFGIASVRDDDYALSQQDIDRFGLTEFPEEQAGRFAADYARLCMTHSTEEGGEERRQQQLAEYVSSGVDATCGWSGAAEQQVTDATWTGNSEPIDVEGLERHARMMTVRVLTADERSQMLTVPVYVANLGSGQGMRVIGDIGQMPQTLLVGPPPAESVGQVDQELTEALLNDQFFQQFFEAWGASDEPSINRFVTPKATDSARAGLSDTLQEPSISDAEVFLPADADTEHTWSQGDRTEAYVWVTWQNPSLGADVTVTRAYRLQLVMTEQAPNVAQGWAVHDVRGGVPSVETN